MTKLKYRVICKSKIIGFIEHFDFMAGHGIQFYTGKDKNENLENISKISEIVGVDAVEYEQFTGLRDKNGREIYEGDILEEYGEVGYMHGSFVAGKLGSLVYVYAVSEEVEVIGNIHENPELA